MKDIHDGHGHWCTSLDEVNWKKGKTYYRNESWFEEIPDPDEKPKMEKVVGHRCILRHLSGENMKLKPESATFGSLVYKCSSIYLVKYYAFLLFSILSSI